MGANDRGRTRATMTATHVGDPRQQPFARVGAAADSVPCTQFRNPRAMNIPSEAAMTHDGSCLCGAVRFTVTGPLGVPDACHCTACRKQTGHHLASTDVPKAALAVSGAVSWYPSSAKVRRGFCGVCGSTLFWDPVARDWIGVAMGAFDGPTGVALALHIFVAGKGDYYVIAGGLLQNMA